MKVNNQRLSHLYESNSSPRFWQSVLRRRSCIYFVTRFYKTWGQSAMTEAKSPNNMANQSVRVMAAG